MLRKMRDLIQAQELFCSIILHSSFYKGIKAVRLGEQKADVLLSYLEKTLAEALFEDRIKGVPTKSGWTRYKQWAPAIQQLQLLSSDSFPEGLLRFSFPYTTGTTLFAPITAELSKNLPNIKFDIQFSSGSGQPVWYNTDLRVVHKEYFYEDVKEFPLAQAKRIVIGTPSWKRKHPIREPSDLEKCEVYGTRDAVERERIVFRRGSDMQEISFHTHIITRNNLAALNCALTGNGFGILIPRYLAEPYLKRRQLVEILPDWTLPSLELRAIVPNQKIIHPVILSWINVVRQKFTEQPENFICQ